jgi:predicted GH43/DUF377 family glycosyl hydrolase
MTKWYGPIAAALMVGVLSATPGGTRASPASTGAETAAGWHKYQGNPVLGGKLGTCFDISVLKKGVEYLMWFSWRPRKSIALVRSRDGIHWSAPVIVLEPDPKSPWQSDVNRPVVIEQAGKFHMWYTGQSNGHSSIGYAVSTDGIHWKRMTGNPVLSPDEAWERVAVMCPDVIWDGGIYRMWYSGGEQYEPNAIGAATSRDGIHWTKSAANPVFTSDEHAPWEQQRVTGCQVIRLGGWYYMFYIGFENIDHAQIGLARSKDGISDWQRLPANPIIRTGTRADEWDHDACYKPYVVWDGKQKRWLLWYNGRDAHFEQIGLAVHEGKSLGFADEGGDPAATAK